ncbi:hypothetical protein NZD89_00585 [Alicyclobacillus fastidiosus]|uniref:Uncharacterized protein n=1 Tax=Alicyclobacillus fastidiosus TaxID=392011 RepID=A0ABY6ZIL3_9BACL|nr:hypothetical protein [Alicyclobacillus fastidiosus]WAH42051.1 hypothetical protein NZD89_00585 [Alicyclobacillus fastidiosus]GMA63814.1 hypothetical protein GCM10025859_42540 [Alicyclobacillus fastidiosus]
MALSKLFYACSVLLVVYVGLSSTFIMNAYLMLAQWLVILLIMNIWGTVVKRSVHYGTWFAICGWFVALIIQQFTVFVMQCEKGGALGDFYSAINYLEHDLHQTFIGILMIVPAIPTGYVCSWITKKAMYRTIVG